MRRYADILVHKLLAGWKVSTAVLEQEVAWINTRAHFCKVLQDLYTHWKITHWLKQVKVLEPVYCTDVKKVGVMWFMPSLHLNGFTHVSGLVPSQFWAYDEGIQTLTGGQTKQTIHVGQKLVPILDRLDPITGGISLILTQTV
jgi:exoribonuclease R